MNMGTVCFSGESYCQQEFEMLWLVQQFLLFPHPVHLVPPVHLSALQTSSFVKISSFDFEEGIYESSLGKIEVIKYANSLHFADP